MVVLISRTISASISEMFDAQTIEKLNRTECVRLLPMSGIGRIVFIDHMLLAVHPVRYIVDGGSIVFRTQHGAKVEAGDRRELLAFEVDSIDPETGHGWSVVASGNAEHVIDAYQLSRLGAIIPTPWAPAEHTDVIRLSMDILHGRRYAPSANN